MAKEKKEEPKPKGEGKKGKHHLHEIRSTQAHDGSIVHSHTYKANKDDAFTMPERGPMATSSTPEEAGQHVAEMFGQNAAGGGAPPPEEAGGGGPPPQGGAPPPEEA